MPLIMFAQPGRFLELARLLLPFLWGAAFLLLGGGIFLSFFATPPDYQQGTMVRILFLHVPAALLSLAAYGVLTISSIGSLVWRHPLAEISLKAAILPGTAFTLVTMFTGAVWGKKMWGAWWVWDPRLTSVFILFMIYMALFVLWKALEGASVSGRALPLLALFGFVDIPIVKYSVTWWNSQHQPSGAFRWTGSTIHESMQGPLFLMIGGFMFFYAAVHLMGMRNEILAQRIRALLRRAAARPAMTLRNDV